MKQLLSCGHEVKATPGYERITWRNCLKCGTAKRIVGRMTTPHVWRVTGPKGGITEHITDASVLATKHFTPCDQHAEAWEACPLKESYRDRYRVVTRSALAVTLYNDGTRWPA